jgi:hypothetical protein
MLHALCPPCAELFARHPRVLRILLWLAVLSAFFTLLGQLSPTVVMPFACKVYG